MILLDPWAKNQFLLDQEVWIIYIMFYSHFSLWFTSTNKYPNRAWVFTIFILFPYAVVDSLEFIDQDYVLVSGPPIDVPSSSASASKPSHFPYKSDSPPKATVATVSTAPLPIIGAATSNNFRSESLESQSSGPGTSQGSTDIVDTLEQPSTHCMTRLKSLQKCASAISELVNEKVSYDILARVTLQLANLCQSTASSVWLKYFSSFNNTLVSSFSFA